MGGAVLFLLIFLSVYGCTPKVKEVAFGRTDREVIIVKRGSFYFTKEDKRFIKAEAKRLGIRIPRREEIEKALQHYLRDRRGLEIALRRAGLYMPYITPILRRHSLPEELAILPFIESGFNPFARSGSGAGGLWQLMPATAKRYGLRVDGIIDERFDLYRSTEAAARYLRDLYEKFRSWELALAGYNCGEGCVLRRTGGRDFWSGRKNLPLQTQDFVPRFFAALLIARDPAGYGLRVKPVSMRLERRRVEKETSVSEMASRTGVSESSLRDLNPHIRSDSIPTNTFVYVPVVKEKVLRVYRDEPKEDRPVADRSVITYRKPVWNFRREVVKVRSARAKVKKSGVKKRDAGGAGRILRRSGRDVTLILDNGAVVYIKN